MIAAALKDGYGIAMTFGTGESSTDHSGITLSVDPNSITPPGAAGGDAIGTTTHSNSAWQTKSPQSLLEAMDGAFTAAYDPDAWDDIVALINDNVLITFVFPDGESVAVYGYVQSFVPNAFVPGEMPTAECVVVITNRNHNTGLEVAPAYSASS
jgi:hypothetical protein